MHTSVHVTSQLAATVVRITDTIFCSVSTDVNECELLSSVCGEAQCVNVDGSFLCMCPNGHDYDVMMAKCVPVPTGDTSPAFVQMNTETNDINVYNRLYCANVFLRHCRLTCLHFILL